MIKKDVDVKVLAATNDCITDGTEVKDFDWLEVQLEELREAHKCGDCDAVKNITESIYLDAMNVDGNWENGDMYNWRSPLGHLVDQACRRIMSAHGLSNKEHANRREEVMQTVCKWIIDPDIILKTNPETKMTTWISGRISWNGYEVGCKDVGDIYGIHVAAVPKYDKETCTKLGMQDIHTTDISDIEMRDGEESSIFDRTEGTNIISRNPEDVVVGNDSDDAMLLDMVTEGIVQAVRSFCKNYQYNYNDLERYCVDYETRQSSDLLPAKNYGDAAKTLRMMSKSNFYIKKITNLIKNELIIRDIPLEYAEYLINTPWKTPDCDNRSGLRDIIRSAVALIARRGDGVIV